MRQTNEVQDLAEYGCLTRMHVVRLLAPTIDGEDHMKDIDFSPSGIRDALGSRLCRHAQRDREAPWQGEFDRDRGFHPARSARRGTPADA